jgi:NADPH:quinone reductase-like Zn-dependent oxidoreductase
MTSPQLLIDKKDLRAVRVDTQALEPLLPGEARLSLDLFALTANNVTYAAMGDSFRYWNFFPAPDGFGLVPVWGFGTVAESRVDGLLEGERLYGYFPFAQSVVVTPTRLTEFGFVDGVAHRAVLPPVYNQYERVARDPSWSPAQEPMLALFRPLFTTSFLIDDYAADASFFGARRIGFAAASSKTALGAAALLRARGAVEVVGLTSARNHAFCVASGAYDRVVAYDDLGALPAEATFALIDMAGDVGLINALAERLGAAFVANLMVGAAHWDAGAAQAGETAAGPARTLFFAPDRIVLRTKEWGREAYTARYRQAWDAFATTTGWLKVQETRGADALAALWQRLVAGEVGPAEGVIGRF